MFGRQIKLFKLLGFEVKIDASWLIILLLVIWSLARGVFPAYNAGLSSTVYWWMGVVGALGLFMSIILHELSHSLVARRFGLPMKGITLFVFGGVAEMDEEPRSPKAEFYMAIAGPIASFAIGGICYGIQAIGETSQWARPPVMILTYLATINVVLAIFNMIPAFPLDGGRVFRSALWQWKGNLRWATKISAKVGAGFGLLLVFVGILSVVAGGVIGGIWWALIGIFLRSASRTSYQGLLVRGALEGQQIQRFMKTEPVTVSPNTTIDRLVEDYVYRYHFKLFPISHNGNPLSCVNLQDIKSIPREQWQQHTVSELAKPYSSDNSVLINDDAMKALNIMNRTGNSRLMVIDQQGKLQGIISLKDLVRFISLKLDLEENEVQQFEDLEK